MTKQGYVDAPHGQVHYIESRSDAESPSIYLLHATAYSGRSFQRLLAAMNPRLRVVALDTPGYGNSAPVKDPQQFSQYAEALASAISTLESGALSKVHLFGYHTGAMLAIEIAASNFEMIDRMVLAGVPYFSSKERPQWREKLVEQTSLTEDLEQFSHRWNYFISQRTPGLTLEHAFECFVDELRSYPNAWHAHGALFNYRATERLAQVRCSSLVLDFTSALNRQSLRAARAIPHCEVWHVPDLGGAPLQLQPDRLAHLLELFFRV